MTFYIIMIKQHIGCLNNTKIQHSDRYTCRNKNGKYYNKKLRKGAVEGNDVCAHYIPKNIILLKK